MCIDMKIIQLDGIIIIPLSRMLGFATAIDAESALKNVIFFQITRFFGVFTALPNLQIYFQVHVLRNNP